MATSYSFPYSSFTNAVSLNIPVDQQRLSKEIQNSSITRSLTRIYAPDNSTTIITFSGALTIPQRSTLSGSIVPLHPNNNIIPPTCFSTNPTINDDESKDFYAGTIWTNTLSGSVYHCLNGYENNAVWIRCPQTLNQLTNVNLTGATSSTILTFSGGIWRPKTALQILPSAGAMYFGCGNPNAGTFIGLSITTTNYQSASQLASFTASGSAVLTLFISIGTTLTTPTITVSLNINNVNTSLSTTFTTGGVGIKNAIVSRTGSIVPIRLYDRICLRSSIATNTANLIYVGATLTITN